MFDQREFSTWVCLAKVYLIHKGADEEDASARTAEDVFGRQGVGESLGVETYALISHLDEQVVGRGLKGDGDVLAGVVGISVKDGVDDCLADGHGDVAPGVLIEADALGVIFRRFFCLIHARERGRQSHAYAACG